MKKIAFILLLTISFSVMVAQAQPATKVIDGKTYLIHKVIAGETLYKIAKKHGCTVLELQNSNPDIKVLHPGDKILVPQKGVVAKQPTAVQPATPVRTDYLTYKVKKGETLSQIARDHKTTVEEIKRINNLGSAGLKIGQILKIPAGVVSPEIPIVKPAENKVDSNQPKKEPEVVVVKPAVNKPEVIVEDKTNPGMPASPRVTVQETAVEKEEIGMAKVITDKMDQTRTFVMHPYLPKGSILVVINESSGKMAYCRVIDNASGSDLAGASIGITKAVAEKIGLYASGGNVKIKYAAP